MLSNDEAGLLDFIAITRALTQKSIYFYVLLLVLLLFYAINPNATFKLSAILCVEYEKCNTDESNRGKLFLPVQTV